MDSRSPCWTHGRHGENSWVPAAAMFESSRLVTLVCWTHGRHVGLTVAIWWTHSGLHVGLPIAAMLDYRCLLLLDPGFHVGCQRPLGGHNFNAFLARPSILISERRNVCALCCRLPRGLQFCTHLGVVPRAPKNIRQMFGTHPKQNGGQNKMAALGAMGSPRDHCARLLFDTRYGKT